MKGGIPLKIILQLEIPKPISIAYNKYIQAQIYKFIDDLGWHDNGYNNCKFFRPFSFSNLLGDFIYDKQSKMLHARNVVELHIQSPIKKFIETFVASARQNGVFHIGTVSAIIQKIDVFDIPRVTTDSIEFQTLSPICIPIKNSEGKFKDTYRHIDLNEWNKHFTYQLCQHYNQIHNESLDPTKYSVRLTNVYDHNKVVIKYKNGFFTGHHFTGTLQGDPKLLNQAVQLGMGAYLPRGFGLIERM